MNIFQPQHCYLQKRNIIVIMSDITIDFETYFPNLYTLSTVLSIVGKNDQNASPELKELNTDVASDISSPSIAFSETNYI